MDFLKDWFTTASKANTSAAMDKTRCLVPVQTDIENWTTGKRQIEEKDQDKVLLSANKVLHPFSPQEIV